MKKVFTTLSALLVIIGLKAQTTVKKETTPQVKPSATTVKPNYGDVKGAATAKYGIADSMKEAHIKHEGIKNATIKDEIKQIKEGHIKGGHIKEGTIKEGTIKQGTIKEGAIKEATIKESPTYKQATIKK